MDYRSVDSLLLDFDRRLQAGQVTSIEDTVRDLPTAVRVEALKELVAIDLQHAWLRGQRRLLEEYFQRYPELQDSAECRNALLEEEFIARRRAGDQPEAGEFAERFGHDAEQMEQRWQQICERYAVIGKQAATKTVDHHAAIGQVLQERYKLLERIGQGAHADVYRAEDQVLHRDVAVKLSRQPLMEGSEAAQRFFREAESIAQLQHPGIVSVYEFGRFGSQLYIVEEWVSHGTLDERLRAGAVAPDQAVRWLREICNAVDYAHQCGVVHRDLKPANVLVDAQNRLRVGDFGLAARRDGELRLTHEGELLGTPAYMSPEQVRGDADVGPASDVYALGAMLYQMLTGTLPFSGSTASVLNQILHVEPKRLRSTNSRIAMDLETICLVAMAKESDRRYASARDLAEDLRRFQESEPLRARRTSWLGLMRLWIRRQPLTAAVIFVALLTIGTVAAASFSRITNERNRYRSERDRANIALYGSLMSNAENELRVKSAGWHERSMNFIEEAAAIPSLIEDRRQLRDLAIESLLDPTPRFELVATFEHPGEDVNGTGVTVGALSLDRNDDFWVATGDTQGRLFLHHLESGKVVPLGTLDSSIQGVHFDRSSRRLITLSAGQLSLRIVDASVLQEGASEMESTSGEPHSIAAEGVFAFDVTEGGEWLACGFADGRLEIYRWHGDTYELELDWQAHDAGIVDVQFSDNTLLLATAGADRFAKCWETESGALLKSLLTPEAPRSLGFLRNDRGLIWTSYETYTFFQWDFSGTYREFGGIASSYRGVRELSNGLQITVSLDGQLTLWSGERQLASIKTKDEPNGFAVSATDGTIAVGFVGGSVAVWRIADSKLNRRFPTQHALDLDREGRVYSHGGRLSAESPRVVSLAFDINTAIELVTGVEENLVAFVNGAGRMSVWRDGVAQTIDLGHAQSVTTLSIGNRDRWLITSDATGPIKIWDSASLKLLKEVDVAVGPILQVAADPQEGRMVVAGKRRALLWDESEREIVVNQHVQFSAAAAFGPNGIAITRSDGSVAVLSLDGCDVLATIAAQAHSVNDLKFSPQGERLYLLYANSEVSSWNWQDGSLLRKTSLGVANHHQLVVDPRGDYIIALTMAGRAKVLQADSLQRCLQITNLQRLAGFSPDGEVLWHAGSGLFEMSRQLLGQRSENAMVGESEAVLEDYFPQVIPGGHFSTVWSIDVSPDGRWTATSSFDQHVKVWDNHSGELVANLHGHREMVWRVRFSPDGQWLFSGSVTSSQGSAEVVRWRCADWSEDGRVNFARRLVAGMDCHPKQPWLAVVTFDGTIAILNFETLEILASAKPFQHPLLDVQFNSQGTLLAASCLRDGLALWPVDQNAWSDAALADPQLLNEGDERVWGVAFSPDDRMVAAGCESGAVQLYDVENHTLLASLRTGSQRLRYLRFSPDGASLWCAAYAGEGAGLDLKGLRQQLEQLGLAW